MIVSHGIILGYLEIEIIVSNTVRDMMRLPYKSLARCCYKDYKSINTSHDKTVFMRWEELQQCSFTLVTMIIPMDFQEGK